MDLYLLAFGCNAFSQAIAPADLALTPSFEPLEGRLPPAGFGSTFGQRVADAAPTKEILTDTPLTGREFGQTIAEGAQFHRGGPNQPTP